MNEKSLRILEFNKIKEKIKTYARTYAGKEKIEELKPYDNLFELNNKLEETDEALQVLIGKGNPPLEGLFDIHEGVERARKGGTLTPGQLLKIGSTLRATRNMKEFFKREENEQSYERLED